MKKGFLGLCSAPAAMGQTQSSAAMEQWRKDVSPQEAIVGRGSLLGASELELAQEGDIRAVFSGRPRWLDSECAAIGRDRGHARALLHAWSKYGLELVNFIENHFSIALIDDRTQQAFFAIDRMGIGNLYYSSLQGSLLFSTRIGSILSHPAMDREIDPQAIYNYIFFHMIPSPGTIYRNIRKLQPAECIHWNAGDSKTWTYWTPEFNEDAGADFQSATGQLLPTLQRCVKATTTHQAYGAFLSGGIDSSTVSGVLSQVSDTAPDTYSIGFHAEGYDEIPYSRIASKHFGTRSHEYYVNPSDVAGTVHAIASAYEEPFGNSSALPAFYCAKVAAEDGIGMLIAGDGGDELFAGNARYAKQFLFEPYRLLPAFLRKRVLEPFAARFLSSELTLLRKPSSYIEQAKVPLPERLEAQNYLRLFEDQSAIFKTDFLKQIDTEQPMDMLRERYWEPDDASTLNRMLYLDWKFTLADNDIRKVSTMCQLAGVNVAYPMLDDRLVAFSCSVPSKWKLSKGKLRHFFKQGIKGFVPDEIISKKKHGFGLPFGEWTATEPELQELAYGSVRKLEARGIFQADFLEQAITLHRDGHAKAYGTLIWILMMLELWLEAHTD